MNSLKNITKFIKCMDIFGVNLSFTYASKSSYRTVIGSFFTVILVILFIYKFSLSVKNLILKENIRVQIEEMPVDDDYIDLKNLEIAVCPLYGVMLGDFSYEKYYNFSYYLFDEAQYSELNKDYMRKSTCTRSARFKNSEMAMKDYCFCLKFDENKYLQLNKHSSLFEDQVLVLKLDLNFSYIEETANSSLQKDMLSLVNEVAIFFPGNYVNSTDYFEPIRSTQMLYTTESLVKGAYKEVYMQTNKIQVDKVNDIYTFGLVKPDIQSNYSYSITKNLVTINYDSVDADNGIILLKFKYSGLKLLYTMNSFNLESFVSQFGGYFQVFFVVFNLISTFVNENALENIIQKKFLSNMKNVSQIIFEIDNYSSLPNYNKERDVRDRESKILLNLNNKNKMLPDNSEQEIINKDRSEQDMHFIFKNVNPVVDRVKNDYSNGSCNLFPLPLPRQVEGGLPIVIPNHPNNNNIPHNPALKKQISLKMKIDKLDKNKKYSKELVKDFYSLLDYENFYNFAKEIKIMKFFLFDSETLYWIHKFQKVPFCVEKIESFITEKHIEYKLNTFEDPFHQKLKILKDFLLTYNTEQ